MTTHVEDFAARLRELKERSGRSYGQLAPRLHVSTSTLHRYCTGAAVPPEYAPVERLARLCGATPEDLLTLHRTWLLATTTRRPTPVAPAAAEPQPAPGQAPQAAAGGAAEPAAADATGSPAAPADDADHAGAAEGFAEPVPEAALAAAELPAAPAPGADRAGAGAQGAGRRGAWWGRRGALVAGAVVAVGVAGVLPVALQGGGGSHGGSPAAGAARAGGGAAVPSGPAGRVAAPATTAGPTRGVGAPPATSAPARSADPSPEPSGSDLAPFRLNVLDDNWDTQCGQWFLMPQRPGKVPPPPSLEQTGAWAEALGGVAAGHLRLQVTAQTAQAQPVVLHNLYVHVVSSKPAPKGNVYTPGAGCGGGLDPASFAVDLDATTPRTKPVAGFADDGRTRTRTDFPYKISTSDPQVLDVDASTADRDVSWYLELTWSCGDRSGRVTVDDHGRPFRTVGLHGDTAYFYNGTAWAPTTAED
ncbi:helix-turn-helix domain-containing protein [Actinacidiphila epipremni]|uniref:Helix-turn-helix domain-containing protein n=1 Tax=Actinacidiphila epipremni TaxID=2053013 RepID=A0ABX0ZLD2_9ACTN|nr:helix-turn-helix transcriptional regulator [Actinacidiphila epipremni]NJP43317.1 helix-turn-helix domain-containing protein [Actinacidiphila epipremni]